MNLAQISNEEGSDIDESFFGTDTVTDGQKGKEQKEFGKGDDFNKAFGHFQELASKYSSASAIPTNELPE